MDSITTISASVDSRQPADSNRSLVHCESHAAIPDDMYHKAIRALLWKLDKHLIPFLTLLELFSFLNRINIGKYNESYIMSFTQEDIIQYFDLFLGNAKIAGIDNALNLTQEESSWAVSFYFIGFVSKNCSNALFSLFCLVSFR